MLVQLWCGRRTGAHTIQGKKFSNRVVLPGIRKEPVHEYYKKLAASDRRKALRLFQIMGKVGKIRNKEQFRNEGDKIYAFKPQPHRFLCFFFIGSKIIVTNAFIKKQQKLPEAEKDRALKCKEDYENRIKKGTYYEKES